LEEFAVALLDLVDAKNCSFQSAKQQSRGVSRSIDLSMQKIVLFQSAKKQQSHATLNVILRGINQSE
jgi:hypothetical protein